MNRQAILNGSRFYLNGDSETSFWLKYQNWNDFDYYTTYALFMKRAGMSEYLIAYLNLFNVGQKGYEKPSWAKDAPACFISSTLWRADKLFLLLSPEERRSLADFLGIRYDAYGVDDELAFRKSVLRGTNLHDFNKTQSEIRKLMESPINVKVMFDEYSTQLGIFMDELASIGVKKK